MTIDAKDLVRVIRACHSAHVVELKIGDVEIKFGNGETPKLKISGPESPFVDLAELEKSINSANVGENLAEAEDRLDLLQIENPALYEQLTLERELEDIGKPSEIPDS